jgi:hypothetical protein
VSTVVLFLGRQRGERRCAVLCYAMFLIAPIADSAMFLLSVSGSCYGYGTNAAQTSSKASSAGLCVK